MIEAAHSFFPIIKIEEECNMADNKNRNSKMSREEAGRMGGEATSNNHDQDFYEEIGRKGGEATSENHDRSFYESIGEKGGNAQNNNNNNKN
jgi:uncharacterized protein